MTCPRCQGLVVEETEADEEGIRDYVRCVNCGWRPAGVVAAEQTAYRFDSYDRHKRYRDRCRAKGLCWRCGQPATHGTMCWVHRLKVRLEARLRMRKKDGYRAWRPGGLGRPPLPT